MTSASAEYSFARTSGSRIQSLDGLRCLSILLVMAFHYYSRWTPPENAINHYPYGDAFAYWPPAQWGFLGVQLFFVISGFVIALTLSRCHSIVEFAVRRLARLWPTMFLCSVLTLVTLKLLPESPFAVSALNFVPSWLFTDPAIFNALTGERTFGWMDGAYWSLFVEVRFYVLVAALYFADRSRFTRNLTLAGGLIAVAYAICKYIAPGAPETVLRWVFIAHDLPWFLIGAGMYLVNSERKHSYWLIAVGLAALLCNATIAGQLHLAVAAFVLPAVAWCALCLPRVSRFFSLRPIAAIGAASYSLYLLHQYIGVTLICRMASFAPESKLLAVASVTAVAAVITMFALLIHRFWESPWNAWIVRVLASRLRRSADRRSYAGSPDPLRS